MNYLSLPISSLFGLLAPFVISYLKQTSWSVQVKLLVSFIVSCVFAGIAVFTVGSADFSDYVGLIGVVFTVATIFYSAYFKETDWNQKLTDIEIPAIAFIDKNR